MPTAAIGVTWPTFGEPKAWQSAQLAWNSAQPRSARALSTGNGNLGGGSCRTKSVTLSKLAWITECGRGADRHGGGVVALVDVVVVAVPVEVHALARLLVPDRRQVDGADACRRREDGRP